MIATLLYVLFTSIAGAGTLALVIFLKYPWLRYDIQYLRKFIPVVLRVIKYHKACLTIADLFEKRVRETPKKTFLIFQDNVYTYEYMDKKANQVARAALSLGLKRGDTVALMIYNEPAFIWTYLGRYWSILSDHGSMHNENVEHVICMNLDTNTCYVYLKNRYVRYFKHKKMVFLMHYQ